MVDIIIKVRQQGKGTTIHLAKREKAPTDYEIEIGDCILRSNEAILKEVMVEVEKEKSSKGK